jgi:site-specific DNA-methyltransferase (adenine-specific)
VIEHDSCVLLHGDASEIGDVLDENSIDSIVTDPPAGVGFMSNKWDSDKGGREKWVAWLADLLRPALRALKPGGYAAVWALPRTSHWTAWALEVAGFEVVDVVHHLFGTGMPKSLDLAREIDMHLCELPGRHMDKNPHKNPRPDDHFCPPHPRRDEAQQMRTALKPAAEHWILARKPRVGTYADNVLEHGTGGLNIEACRPGFDPAIGPPQKVYSGAKGEAAGQVYGASGKYDSVVSDDGNWPPHVVIDEYAAELINDQAPKVKGGAARFFYCAKAARSEKDRGLEHLPKKTGGEATGREDDSIGTQNPRAGAGRTGGARNHHPTVKSVALMSWLVQLVTPPGGVVLDLFAGSGTTGVAALWCGLKFVGVELGGDDGEYLPIVEGRLRHVIAALGADVASSDDDARAQG